MYILKKKYINEKNDKRFNKLLKENGIKQKDLAEIIGVDRSYISQIANGNDISKLCAYAICKAVSADLEIIDLFKQI